MYGILISIALISSVLLIERSAKKRGLYQDLFWNVAFWTILFGIIGARLYHALDLFGYYISYPLEFFQVWDGGLGIYGGLIGGIAGIFFSLRDKKESMLEWLDLGVIYIPLAQGIGRLGNYFNNELMPYAIYEMVFNLVLFVILLVLSKRKLPKGKLFFTYLLGYGLIRFGLEHLRPADWEIAGLNVAQSISIVLIVTAMKKLFTTKNIITLLGLVGIGISGVLTYYKLTLNPAICDASGGCYAVQTSEYSTLFGVPLGIWGMLFYIVLLGLNFINKTKLMKYWLIWGVLFSTYLTGVEIFLIEHICDWCLASFINILVISGISLKD